MLQGLNLPFTEFTPPESGLNYSVTLPEKGVATAITFADIFRPEPAAPPLLPAIDGAPLPASGKDLPRGPAGNPPQGVLDAIETELLQTDVLAANPLPIATPLAASAPLQVSLGPQPAGTTAATGLMPSLSASIPSQAATPGLIVTSELSRDGLPPSVAQVSPQAMNERANALLPAGAELPRPLPAAAPVLVSSAAEGPLLPANGEAVANVREQVTADRKMSASFNELQTAIEQAGSRKPLPEAISDTQLQPARPVPTVPTTVQLAPLTPVASGSSDPLLGQQMQISPLQLAVPANRGGAELNVTPQSAPALIATPVNEPAWGDRVGDRLLLMASNKMQTAEIRLTPAELGPLRVRIALDDGTATVNFHAQHAVTRDALEQAMPRLRELFAENGLTLQQGDLSDSEGNGVHQGEQEQENRQATGGAAADGDRQTDNAPTESARRTRSDQLVDTFA